MSIWRGLLRKPDFEASPRKREVRKVAIAKNMMSFAKNHETAMLILNGPYAAA